MTYYCLKSLTHKTKVFIWGGVSRGKIHIPSGKFALLPYVPSRWLLSLILNTAVAAAAAAPASPSFPQVLLMGSVSPPSPSQLPLACCCRVRGEVEHFFLVSHVPYTHLTCTKLSPCWNRGEKSPCEGMRFKQASSLNSAYQMPTSSCSMPPKMKVVEI